jgi:hypothetical protein
MPSNKAVPQNRAPTAIKGRRLKTPSTKAFLHIRDLIPRKSRLDPSPCHLSRRILRIAPAGPRRPRTRALCDAPAHPAQHPLQTSVRGLQYWTVTGSNRLYQAYHGTAYHGTRQAASCRAETRHSVPMRHVTACRARLVPDSESCRA